MNDWLFSKDKEGYERLWAITQRASELFKRDHPTGHMPTPLPQFRSDRHEKDPIRQHYEKIAAQELSRERER